MKLHRILLATLIFSIISLSACDSSEGGSSEDSTDLIVPEIDQIEGLSDNDPQIAEQAQQFQALADVAPSNLIPSPAGADNVVMSGTISGASSSLLATILIDSSTGQPSTTSALVTQSNGSAAISTITNPSPSSPAGSITDANGNTITMRFTESFDFVSATFTAGSAPGDYSASQVAEINNTLSADPSFLSSISYGGQTAAEYGQAAMAALAAGKTYSVQESNISDGLIKLASYQGSGCCDKNETPIQKAQASLALTGLAGAAAVVGTIVIIGAIVASGTSGASN